MHAAPRRNHLCLTLTLAVGAACTSLPLPPPPDAGMPPEDAGVFVRDACKASLSDTAQLTVGQGQLSWQELQDNQPVYFERGPQGGNHIWVSLRMRGLRQSGTIVTLRVDDVESPTSPHTLTQRRVVFDLRRDEGGWCTLAGLRMQLDEDPSVVLNALVNHHLAIYAAAEDPEDARAAGSRLVVLAGQATGGTDGGTPDGG